jgi:Protein of unknown function (DUF2959)
MKVRTMLTACLMALLASVTQASQEELATSMKATRVEADQTRDQLATTLAALTTLTKQDTGDLRPAFDAFTAEIPKTEAAAAATGARVTWMQGEGAKYFDDWQATISSINDESLRKKSQQRLDAVKKSYAKVTAEFKAAADKFRPFLTSLADIHKVLSTDLTASGVKGLRSTVNSANSDYKSLDRSMNSALAEMSNMEKELSPEAAR